MDLFILQLLKVKGAFSKIVTWELRISSCDLSVSSAPIMFFKGRFICLINKSRVLCFCLREQNNGKRLNVLFAQIMERSRLENNRGVYTSLRVTSISSS